MKPTLVIFSSGKALPVAQGVRDNLKETFTVEIWSEGFFDEHNTIPLWVFFKKLMCYDFAVVILGDDDVRRKEGSSIEEFVPRDNVIFELGATMARLGPQKTFVLVPSGQKVTLPSYFKGILLLEYSNEPGSRGNYQSATGSAASAIKRHLTTLSEDAFHSDLPAQGLAIGYFNNLVAPIYNGLRESQEFALPHNLPWKPENGFTVTSLIPNEIVNRSAADRILKEATAANVIVRLFRDRDVSAYILPRKNENEPIHILDIPTTLLTANKVIEKIDAFWGSFGDTHFQLQLQQRELLSFARKLRAMRKEAQFDDRIVFIEQLSDLNSHSEKLRSVKPPIL